MSTVYTYAFAGDPNRTPSGGAPSTSTSLTIERHAGADRYVAAANISASHFASGVPVAYVATGQNFPDALAGGPVAAIAGGPVLLVTRDTVPAATAAELNRLRPMRIVVLGGVNSVSGAVATALQAYTAGSVTRLAGIDRYAAAANISASHFTSGVPVAYVATGQNFPDALAGVPPAGMAGGPILLVTTDAIPQPSAAELSRLKPGRIVVLGGPASVSDKVSAGLSAFTSGGVTRLAGANRYSAAVAISAANFDTAATVFVTTGQNFPDALAGGPVATLTGGPVLLVQPTSVPQVVRDELLRLKPTRVVVLGGPNSVSEQVVNQIRALFP